MLIMLPYVKDVDGNLAPAGCFREPVVGENRCGWWVAIWFPSRSCEHSCESVMEPGCPRYGLDLVRGRELLSFGRESGWYRECKFVPEVI